MRTISAIFVAAVLSATPAIAADAPRLTPEQQADSDALRALTKATPVLQMDRVELHPAVKLEGISMVTADARGNIYVIHRPTAPDADPVVVLSPPLTCGPDELRFIGDTVVEVFNNAWEAFQSR